MNGGRSPSLDQWSGNDVRVRRSPQTSHQMAVPGRGLWIHERDVTNTTVFSGLHRHRPLTPCFSGRRAAIETPETATCNGNRCHNWYRQ